MVRWQLAHGLQCFVEELCHHHNIRLRGNQVENRSRRPPTRRGESAGLSSQMPLIRFPAIIMMVEPDRSPGPQVVMNQFGGLLRAEMNKPKSLLSDLLELTPAE